MIEHPQSRYRSATIVKLSGARVIDISTAFTMKHNTASSFHFHARGQPWPCRERMRRLEDEWVTENMPWQVTQKQAKHLPVVLPWTGGSFVLASKIVSSPRWEHWCRKLEYRSEPVRITSVWLGSWATSLLCCSTLLSSASRPRGPTLDLYQGCAWLSNSSNTWVEINTMIKLANSLYHTLIIAVSAVNMDAVNICDMQAFSTNIYILRSF